MKERTKIVATIGPASVSQKTLTALAKSGMDVCRLNFSHGDHVWHKKAIGNIRKVESKLGRKIGIMADIQGPRIRTANTRLVELVEGAKIFLTDIDGAKEMKTKNVLPLDWKRFYQFIQSKDIVFIEDGLMQIEITKKVRNGCWGKVLIGGTVKTHKGVNIPSISAHMGFLTDKDLADLEFMVKQEVDFIAVSFVGCGQDIKSLKQLIRHYQKKNIDNSKRKKKLNTPWVISKVERKKAMENIRGVIRYSDGIMVARGDLAIEMAQEKVVLLQKELVAKCIKQKKPVIVATQMLDSMIGNIRPTRAEIADVTNAVIDGADAVMLSGESANGKYPVETVTTMARIIATAEKSSYNDRPLLSRNKFAKLLFKKKRGRKHLIKTSSLKEALAYAVLRQEEVKVKFSGRDVNKRRKAALIWGVEVF